MMTVLEVAGGSDVLLGDQVRRHATPVSQSEPMPWSRVNVEVSEGIHFRLHV